MEENIRSCLEVAFKLGFEQANKSCISNMLSMIEPSGGTRMRDSIMMGTDLMYRFRAVAEQLGLGQLWNFVHLVITDGKDEHSEISLVQLGVQLYSLQQALPSEFMKTIYIGVDLENDPEAESELEALASLGGDSAELYNVDDSEIDDIFEKIKINLGIQTTRQGLFIHTEEGTLGIVREQNQAYVRVQTQRYMVLFSIDRSGSMQGKKWSNLCKAVDSFLKQLSSDDLVCGLVFNNEVEILTSLNKIRQIHLQTLLALQASISQLEQKQSSPAQKQILNQSPQNNYIQQKQIQPQPQKIEQCIQSSSLVKPQLGNIETNKQSQQISSQTEKPNYPQPQYKELPYSEPKNSNACCSSSSCSLM